MPIDSELNTLLSVLALSDATKAAVAQGIPTWEHLEDIFLELSASKAKVEAMLRHIVDESIVSDIDVRRIMCMMNIVDPNFAWSNFTRYVYVADKQARAVLNHVPSVSTPVAQSTASAVNTIDFYSGVLTADAQRQATPAVPGSVYVADKQDRAVLNHAPSVSTPVAQTTASAISTIDFSSGVLTADAQRQATPAVPGTVATLKPHKLWTSPFACATVRALRTLMPADWGTQTDGEIMDTLYDEDEAIADFH
jgi:hypothetical protein